MNKNKCEYVTPKKLYNLESKEDYNEARIFCGDPNGIIYRNKSNHDWAIQIYANMEGRTWFPKRVNLEKDKKRYTSLTDEEKRAYDLVLAQLATNDSIQSNQLVDNINRYITSPAVNMCIIRQASEEVVHSDAYSRMAEEVTGDFVYYLHEKDEELYRKNMSIATMYALAYDDVFIPLDSNDIKSKLNIDVKEGKYMIVKEPNVKDLLKACTANQILEELVFPGGFAVILSLENKMPGSAEMIAEIMKDETLSHVPLFKNIFRTAVKETFDGIVPKDVEEFSLDLISKMVDAEKRWTKYVSKGLLGFSERAIDIFVEGKGNSVCKNLGLPLLYKESDFNPLQDLLNKHLVGGELDKRTGFFEKNVADYTVGTLDMGDDW